MMPNTITIATKSTANVSGGQVPTYTATYRNVAASIVDESSDTILAYQQRNISISHTIYTATKVSANTGDIIQLGSRQFAVKGFQNVANRNRLYAIKCLEVPSTNLILQGP